MERRDNEDRIDISQLAEITSDCLAVCDQDGTIFDVNAQLAELMGVGRHWVIGTDIKDLLFSSRFERAIEHRLPFSTDGSSTRLMLKLADGSFVPVLARATVVEPARHRHILVVLENLEAVYARDREQARLMEELETSNRRLSGTLGVIMSTVGADDLPSLVQTVLDQLAETLDAKGATVYLSEGGGFRLRGMSRGLAGERVPAFVPYGAGVPTLVVRESRPVRLASMPDVADSEEQRRLTGTFFDLDAHERRKLRIQYVPPFRTLIAVPIYFGTHILGILEAGWGRPYTPRDTDAQVLEVICEYLSIELVSLITSLRSKRRSELSASLSRVRDFLFSSAADLPSVMRLIGSEVRDLLACRAHAVKSDPVTAEEYLDFGDAGRFMLPDDIEEALFSTSSPAVHVGRSDGDSFVYTSEELASAIDGGAASEGAESAQLSRIDDTTMLGEWLAARDLPARGVFVDFGCDEGPRQGVLFLREDGQEPIDDMEYDYLAHLVHDYELFRRGLTASREEKRIAQALQRGMESTLADVPGITADSLYSSATRQTLVGGDFFDLIRLPDDRAVMILGDASGKGIEAASTSAFVKTALRAYAWEGMRPARMVDALNGMLADFSRLETFATMFVTRVDLRASRALYCSAGHPPAMLYRASMREVELLSTRSGIVGAFPDASYENGTFSFERGDILFLYTDGAIEARREDGAFFGEERLRELILRIAPEGIHGLCQRILYELDRFTGGALNDDIAMVALRFDGSGATGPSSAVRSSERAGAAD